MALSSLLSDTAPPVRLRVLGLSRHDAAKIPGFLQIAQSRLQCVWHWEAPDEDSAEEDAQLQALGSGWHAHGEVAVLRMSEPVQRAGLALHQLVRPLQFDAFVRALQALEVLRPQILSSHTEASVTAVPSASPSGAPHYRLHQASGAHGQPGAVPDDRPTSARRQPDVAASAVVPPSDVLLMVPTVAQPGGQGQAHAPVEGEEVQHVQPVPVSTAWHCHPGDRFRLLTWPSTDVLASHRYYPRLAGFLSARRHTVDELVRVSNVSRVDCERFLALMASRGWLHVKPSGPSKAKEAKAAKEALPALGVVVVPTRVAEPTVPGVRVLGQRILGKLRRRLARLHTT